MRFNKYLCFQGFWSAANQAERLVGGSEGGRADLPRAGGTSSEDLVKRLAVALELGVGFIAVRKQDGLFPGEKITRRTPPDYRRLRHELRIQRASLTAGDRVLLVDDWIETGSEAASVKSMVEEDRNRSGGWP